MSKNRRYLKLREGRYGERNPGEVSFTSNEAAHFADRLIYDSSAAARMLCAQNTCLPKDGAERIAGIICGEK